MKAKHTFFIFVMFLGALNQVKAQDTIAMDLKACMRYAVEHSTKMRIAHADNRDAQIDRRDAILAREAHTPIPTSAAASTPKPTPIFERPRSTMATVSRRASTSSTDSRPSTT